MFYLHLFGVLTPETAFMHAVHWLLVVSVLRRVENTLLCLYGTVRQLEQQVKAILDSIAVSEDRKKELIRGDAVDKAEQLSEYCQH